VIRIFLLIILFLYTLNGDMLDDANSAYKNKEYLKAIPLYKKLARDGSKEANFKLGVIYYSGKGVKRDLNRAVRYFQNAANKADTKSKYNLAVIYGLKQYVNHDNRESFNRFLELAKNKDPKAQYRVGMALLYGIGVDKDYKDAVRWFEQSYFIGGYKPAGCSLSLMYVMGHGVLVNLGRAAKLAKDGMRYNLPLCKKVYKEFNLHKYKEDKGFKFSFYK